MNDLRSMLNAGAGLVLCPGLRSRAGRPDGRRGVRDGARRVVAAGGAAARPWHPDDDWSAAPWYFHAEDAGAVDAAVLLWPGSGASVGNLKKAAGGTGSRLVKVQDGVNAVMGGQGNPGFTLRDTDDANDVLASSVVSAASGWAVCLVRVSSGVTVGQEPNYPHQFLQDANGYWGLGTRDLGGSLELRGYMWRASGGFKEVTGGVVEPDTWAVCAMKWAVTLGGTAAEDSGDLSVKLNDGAWVTEPTTRLHANGLTAVVRACQTWNTAGRLDGHLRLIAAGAAIPGDFDAAIQRLYENRPGA